MRTYLLGILGKGKHGCFWSNTIDVLSVAASGVGVVSLAIQLADSINKLYHFWNSVQDAPADLRAMVEELRLLSAVLNGIGSNEKRYKPDPTTTSVLESCIDKVSSLFGRDED